MFIAIFSFFPKDELNTAVQRYLRRIEWLTTGCRKIFGTLVEQRFDMKQYTSKVTCFKAE